MLVLERVALIFVLILTFVLLIEFIVNSIGFMVLVKILISFLIIGIDFIKTNTLVLIVRIIFV